MKKIVLFVSILFFVAAVAFAAAPKSYQVTGPVLDVKPDSITVQKGSEKWEIAKGKETKIAGGEPKVGDKVTIKYTMAATEIENKAGAAKTGAKSPAKK